MGDALDEGRRLEGWFDALSAWLATAGSLAYVVAPLVMGIVAILPLPAEAPAMLNGALFGPLVGTAITWVGALLGAMISFEIAHRFGAPALKRWVGLHRLDRVSSMAETSGWVGLITLRLLPVVAFTAVNWGAGFARVPRWRFFWTTAVGILPGAVVFTASGSGLAMLLERGSGWVGWSATAGVVVFVIYHGRRHFPFTSKTDS